MNCELLLNGAPWQRMAILAQAGAELEERADKGSWGLLYLVGIALVLIAGFVLIIVLFSYGKLFVQALMSNAYVSLLSLVGMSLRQVHARTIVEAKIMAMQ